MSASTNWKLCGTREFRDHIQRNAPLPNHHLELQNLRDAVIYIDSGITTADELIKKGAEENPSSDPALQMLAYKFTDSIATLVSFIERDWTLLNAAELVPHWEVLGSIREDAKLLRIKTKRTAIKVECWVVFLRISVIVFSLMVPLLIKQLGLKKHGRWQEWVMMVPYAFPIIWKYADDAKKKSKRNCKLTTCRLLEIERAAGSISDFFANIVATLIDRNARRSPV